VKIQGETPLSPQTYVSHLALYCTLYEEDWEQVQADGNYVLLITILSVQNVFQMLALKNLTTLSDSTHKQETIVTLEQHNYARNNLTGVSK